MNKTTVSYIYLLTIVTVMMSIGFLIYLKAPNGNFATVYLETNFLDQYLWLASLGNYFPDISNNGFIRYHLADFIWAFCLSVIVVTIWRASLSYISSLIVAILLPMSFEVAQLVGIFKGTFDMIDCLMTAIGGIFAVVISQFIFRKEPNDVQVSV